MNSASAPFPLDGGRGGDGGVAATLRERAQEARRLRASTAIALPAPPPTPPPSRGRAIRGGFTLIECLVALAVFGLAAMALLNLSGESTRSAARVETRTLGGIVADNVAAEAMIARDLPSGSISGQASLGGREWRWVRVVSATDMPGVGRIDVRVFADEEQADERVLFRAAGA